MEKILFREEQKFTQAWIMVMVYCIFILNISIFGYGFVRQIIQGKPWGNVPMSDTALILTCIFAIGISVGLLLLFHSAVLITAIRQDGIIVRFPPFFIKEKFYAKEDLNHIEVRQYNPISEYGGWGVRMGMGKGRAYNVKGNLGIQLQLKSGKKILIGTQKKDQAEHAIRKLMDPGT
jgi:hypothetical protein